MDCGDIRQPVAELPVVECDRCGKPVKRVRRRQRFCSGGACRDAYHKDLRAKAMDLLRAHQSGE